MQKPIRGSQGGFPGNKDRQKTIGIDQNSVGLAIGGDLRTNVSESQKIQIILLAKDLISRKGGSMLARFLQNSRYGTGGINHLKRDLYSRNPPFWCAFESLVADWSIIVANLVPQNIELDLSPVAKPQNKNYSAFGMHSIDLDPGDFFDRTTHGRAGARRNETRKKSDLGNS